MSPPNMLTELEEGWETLSDQTQLFPMIIPEGLKYREENCPHPFPRFFDRDYLENQKSLFKKNSSTTTRGFHDSKRFITTTSVSLKDNRNITNDYVVSSGPGNRNQSKVITVSSPSKDPSRQSNIQRKPGKVPIRFSKLNPVATSLEANAYSSSSKVFLNNQSHLISEGVQLIKNDKKIIKSNTTQETHQTFNRESDLGNREISLMEENSELRHQLKSRISPSDEHFLINRISDMEETIQGLVNSHITEITRLQDRIYQQEVRYQSSLSKFEDNISNLSKQIVSKQCPKNIPNLPTQCPLNPTSGITKVSAKTNNKKSCLTKKKVQFVDGLKENKD